MLQNLAIGPQDRYALKELITHLTCCVSYLFLRFYLFIFRHRGNERGRETSMCGCLPYTPYWGPGWQPRHVPDWESNTWPFGSQAVAQSTEPHQPGPSCVFLCMIETGIKILLVYAWIEHLYLLVMSERFKRKVGFCKLYLKWLDNFVLE